MNSQTKPVAPVAKPAEPTLDLPASLSSRMDRIKSAANRSDRERRRAAIRDQVKSLLAN